MVLIDKLNKRKVYRYLLNEGVIVIKKEFTTTPHKDTEVPNLHVWMLLRSLKDRDYVELIFSWQYYYYFLKNEGKKYLCEFLGLNEEVQPLTWKNDQNKQYEIREQGARRGPRLNKPQGERGTQNRGGRGKRPQVTTGTQQVKAPQAPTTTTPASS